jgi:hypothetical protein
VRGLTPMVGGDLYNAVSWGSSPSPSPSTPFGYSAVRGASVLNSPAGDAVIGFCRSVVDGLAAAAGDVFRDISKGEHALSSVSTLPGGVTGLSVPILLAIFRAAARRQRRRP